MARLTHSSKKSFKRLIQMSSADIFVFIEGKTDRYFYDKICQTVFTPKGIRYSIRLAEELPLLTGGKDSLLKFFSWLNRTSSLLDEFKGKKTISIFCLDKDIDEILKKCKNSKHIIYTEHYCLENYFFIHGDLVEATAAASNLDTASVKRRLGKNSDWRRRVAENWKDWVKLCVYCKKHNISFDCNYGSYSRINNPYNPTDIPSYNFRLAQLEARSGLSSSGFKCSFTWVSKQVDEIYKNNRFDSVFKGKWYSYFLVEDAKIIAGSRAYDSNSLAEKIIASLKTTINYNESWTEHFKKPLSELLKKL